MAATSVLLSVKDKTAAVSVFTTPTVTPHTSGLQVLTVCAIGSVNAESQPAVTIASGLTGQGAITAIPNAGVGGAATTCGIWSFFIKSTTGSVVAGTYQIAFAGASTPTAFSVDVIEYQAGDWDSTLGTPIINGCSSTVITTAPTATFPSAPATTSRCGAFMGSRNKTAALTAGTSPWALLTGTDLHETATPSATSAVEERTGSASTTVDGGNWGTTGNAIIGWEVPAPASSTPITLPAETGTAVDAVTVAATVPLAETGSGADALAVSATVPLSDPRTAVDALTVSPAVPLADTAAGVDALTVSATVPPVADTGTGSDAVTVTATVTLADTGTAVDAISVGVPTPLPGDTGTAVDALTITATVPLTETGAGSDQLAVTAAVPLADPRTAVDALTVALAIPLADTGSSVDALTVAPQIPLADLRTATDALTVAATVPLTDVGTAADQLAVTAAVPLSDARTAADAIVVTATVTLADLATAADAISIQVLVNLTDTATAADAIIVNTGPPPPTTFPWKAGPPDELWDTGTPTDQPPTTSRWQARQEHDRWSTGRATERSPV